MIHELTLAATFADLLVLLFGDGGSNGRERRTGISRALLLQSPRRAPAFAVLSNPVEQCALETNVVAESFGFQPLVLQDFLTLREELLIEARLLHELAGRRRL